MPFSITYTQRITPNTDPALQPGPVRIEVVVTAVTGFTDFGVLVYQIDSVVGLPYYSHPATPADLSAYNYQVPGDKNFVRLGTLDMYVETAEQGESILATIEARLQLLCSDMEILQTFGDPVVITVSS